MARKKLQQYTKKQNEIYRRACLKLRGYINILDLPLLPDLIVYLYKSFDEILMVSPCLFFRKSQNIDGK